MVDYSITQEILKNISNIEYNKAIIENTVLLPNIESKLQIKAQAKKVAYSLRREGLNIKPDEVRHQIQKMVKNQNKDVESYQQAILKLQDFSNELEFDQVEIKSFAQTFLKTNSYRSTNLENKTKPAEILAEITKLLDFNSSLEAVKTHPIIRIILFKGQFELISPFKSHNFIISDLITTLDMRISNYSFNETICFEQFLATNKKEVESIISQANKNDDFTLWLEFFTNGLNSEIANVAENIKVLAKDSKLAKAAGTKRLGSREERIVTYIQDFGMIRNKDYSVLFPNLSEDTILRELKKLQNKGIIVKRGKTKSSRYELV